MLKSAAKPALPPTQLASRKKLEKLKRNMELTLLILPAAAILFCFHYLPITGIVIAFKNYKPIKGIWGSAWYGFRNFEFIFRSRQFLTATWHTIVYNLGFIFLGAFCSVALAVFLYEIKRSVYIKIYQTVIMMPHFLSWVVISVILYAFLSSTTGILNKVLAAMGIERISWYTTPRAWPSILTIMYLWRNVGYRTLIYYAAMMGINPQLFESAELDGAGRWKKTIYITVPSLLPVVTILLILSLGRLFYSDFGLFYNLTLHSGPLIKTTDVINWYTFRALFSLNDYGMGAAVGLIQGLIGFILVLATNRISRGLSRGEHGLF